MECFALGQLLCQGNPQAPEQQQVQAFAFRALRFLYAVERNRKVFHHLFSPELYALFIDMVSHCLFLCLFLFFWMLILRLFVFFRAIIFRIFLNTNL